MERPETRIASLEAEIHALEDQERRRQAEVDRLQRIFDYSNDAIFVVDPVEDEILDVNRQACRMLGYSREELLSIPMSVIHPHEMHRMREFARSVFEQGSGWTDELTCLTKPGKTLAAEISASLVDLDGRPCMVAMVRDVSERVKLARVNEYLQTEIRSDHGSIIAESPALLQVLQRVERVAQTEASVLITGESGTGKELIATAIHEQSARSDEAFVRVNCASVPETLFESEFFGHLAGAFTGAVRDRAGRFELASGGTIFLDEIGEIPLGLQSKLLRVLQEGQFERIGDEQTRRVDVRVIAATNRDLPREVDRGAFRQDLFYRLDVFPIDVPPLRERREDIPVLVRHFVAVSASRLKMPMGTIREEEVNRLLDYHWPGNVRELQNVVERAMILTRGGELRFDLGDGTPSAAPPLPFTPRQGLSLADIKRLERDVMLEALQAAGGKLYGDQGAAARLGLKPTTLASRLKKLGIR